MSGSGGKPVGDRKVKRLGKGKEKQEGNCTNRKQLVDASTSDFKSLVMGEELKRHWNRDTATPKSTKATRSTKTTSTKNCTSTGADTASTTTSNVTSTPPKHRCDSDDNGAGPEHRPNPKQEQQRTPTVRQRNGRDWEDMMGRKTAGRGKKGCASRRRWRRNKVEEEFPRKREPLRSLLC